MLICSAMNGVIGPNSTHTIKLISKYRKAETRVGVWPLLRNEFCCILVVSRRSALRSRAKR
jgi:hypothetical protein